MDLWARAQLLNATRLIRMRVKVKVYTQALACRELRFFLFVVKVLRHHTAALLGADDGFVKGCVHCVAIVIFARRAPYVRGVDVRTFVIVARSEHGSKTLAIISDPENNAKQKPHILTIIEFASATKYIKRISENRNHIRRGRGPSTLLHVFGVRSASLSDEEICFSNGLRAIERTLSIIECIADSSRAHTRDSWTNHFATTSIRHNRDANRRCVLHIYIALYVALLEPLFWH